MRFDCVVSYYLLTRWYPHFRSEDAKKVDMKTAFSLWDEFQLSAKARYLTTFASEIGGYDWDPLLVCHCLDVCIAVNAFEGLEYANVCDYMHPEDEDILRASLFPELTYPLPSEGETSKAILPLGSL